MSHSTPARPESPTLPGGISRHPIPFLRVETMADESQRMLDAISKGHVGGDGPYTKRCQTLIEQTLGVPKVLMTTSCTHALEICGMLLDLGPDDEVIVPSFTFVSTANAFAVRGCRIIFADIREDTLSMDEDHVSRLLSPRTRAIVPMHYASVACEMNAITDMASRRGICVIEDNAHALYAKYQGRFLGTFGDLATQSFDEMKNFTCGQGGALVINNTRFAERAEILRDKGTNRSRFFRGQVDKYTWVDVGSNYSPSDILMAFLSSQLDNRQAIQSARRRIWERYHDGLRKWASVNNIRQPVIPADCEQVHSLYFLLMPTLSARQAFISHMKSFGIPALFHYQALHAAAMGQRYGAKPEDCPVSISVADRLVRLPFFNTLSSDDQEYIIDGAIRFSV